MKTDEQQIRDVVSAWMEATKVGDIDKVVDLMTDDVVFLLPGGQSMSKSDYVAAAKAQAAPGGPKFDGSSEIQEIIVAGEWAFLRSWLKVVIKPPEGSRAMERSGYTLTVFRKQNGRWLLARDANLLGAAKPADS